MINAAICFFTNLLLIFLMSCCYAPRLMKFATSIDESAEKKTKKKQFPANKGILKSSLKLQEKHFLNKKKYPF